MISLLDANVLIALFDSAHIHHQTAHRWFEKESPQGWASCAVTQNACIRILSQPSYPGRLAVADIALRLWKATRSERHHFWPDRIEPCDPKHFDHSRVLTPKHLTDLYLLGLAVENGGRLVSFDRGISTAAVPAAETRHLLVL